MVMFGWWWWCVHETLTMSSGGWKPTPRKRQHWGTEFLNALLWAVAKKSTQIFIIDLKE